MNTMKKFYPLYALLFFPAILFFLAGSVSVSAKTGSDKNNYIKNARFSLKQNINPYNYTIKLKSSRIILKKEIKKSKLSLVPEGKKSPKLSASFSKLSSNGKEIVYLLNQSSQKKLCPHDSSMNGRYIVRSNSFSKKLKATYVERLDAENMSGFVLDAAGDPIENTFISYRTKKATATSRTDSIGHYQIKASGAPVSLTATKKGYQTETLTSLTVSKSGTICENIILKQKKEQDGSLDFYIKEEDGTPIPHARVLLVPQKNSRETALTSGQALLSAETDIHGTLLFTNSGNRSYLCSKITVSKNLLFSLLSSYTSTATQKYPLPDTYSPEQEYRLYITKNSYDGSPSYEPAAITFSPASFYTNHLYFEITLKKRGYTDFSGLSILPETQKDWDAVKKIRCMIYDPQQKKPVYETFLSLEEERMSFKNLSVPVSLSDGLHYVKITGETEKGEPLFSSAITEIRVKNNFISPISINLQMQRYSRLLAYFSGSRKPEEKVSIDLYQKAGTHYFYLESVTSSSFTQTVPDLYTADFSFSGLQSSESYLFVPKEDRFHVTSLFTDTISAENLYQTPNEAISSPPFAKCSCTYAETKDYPSLESFFDDSLPVITENHTTITKQSIRTASSYPNSVIVLYKKDGTFISTTLSPKLDKNTVFSKNSSMIIDIYTNHERLLTNQRSYQN